MRWLIVGWIFLLDVIGTPDIPYPFYQTSFEKHYEKIHPAELRIAKEQAKEMFYFGYDNYMEHAFPLDELDPIHCKGRGPDYDHPENININDVLGDYSLGLVDALNTLAVLGNKTELHKAVRLVIENVSFEKNVTVQVFEATIRVIGSLLSTHLILTNENHFLGNFTMPDYDGELLTMAHDLAIRLLPAFENTRTGLPYPRVNLIQGVLPHTLNETCTSGAGSLQLEFGVLSRLLNDETYELLAKRVNAVIWKFRHKQTGLLGNVIDIQTGEWRGILSGVGAGLDSFYEYLLKSHVLFGEETELQMFLESQRYIFDYLRRGRSLCRLGEGDPPFFVNVDMRDGSTLNTWVDALQASYAGVQVLAGNLDEAICLHGLYYAIWRKYEMIPERYNWHLKSPDVYFYPLRPEFAESTYLLYQATRSPFYQHVGREIIDAINLHTRVLCGFATVHNVLDKSLEDRMESFFLSETCKYLYLLFDEDNPVNKHYDRLVFSTEGHIFPITEKFRTPSSIQGVLKFNESCESPDPDDRLRPPLPADKLKQLYDAVGFSESFTEF